MAIPTNLELKKLTATCRKYGIKTFKTAEFEITLTEDMPEPKRRKSRSTSQAKLVATDDGKPFQSDTLDESALLFWSTGGIDETQDSAS